MGGCGCKNKGNETPQQPQTQQNPPQQSQVTQQSVQETIKKTIEKYYTKKG
jgi:hypothetical protein